jgi:hypothetical protein
MSDKETNQDMPEMATEIKTPEKTVNPLQAYFRRPAIYVQLPSGGKFNEPGELEIPENGEIPVYPMTAKDEILMRTPDALMNGATTVEVIQSCCPNIKNAWKLSALDIDLVLVSIRIATYGESTEIKGVCPKCNEENNYELDLRTITDKVTQLEYKPSITVSDLKIHFKPLTYEAVTKEAIKNFEQQRMIQGLASDDTIAEQDRIDRFQDAFVRLTVYSVGILAEAVGYVEMADGTKISNRQQISEFIANCDRTIYNSIKTHLEESKTNSTIDPIQFECAGNTDTKGNHTPCGEKWQQPFTIDNSTFFG